MGPSFEDVENLVTSHPHPMLDPDHPSNAQTTAASSVRSGGGGGDDAGADDGDGRETRGFDEKHSLSAAQKLLLDEPARGGADELCFGAPRPWSPLAAKRRRLTFDLGNATSMLDAAARLQEEEEDDEDAIEEEGGKGRPRRSLAAFKTASLGGKTGPSCDLKAALKARQGCSEARALKRCEQESKTRKEVGAEEQTLASCLQDIRSCPASHAQLRRTAVKLKGMQYLAMASPACIVHHAGGGCAPLTENKETGLLMGGCGERGGGPKVGCDAAAGFENRVPMPPADGFKVRRRSLANPARFPLRRFAPWAAMRMRRWLVEDVDCECSNVERAWSLFPGAQEVRQVRRGGEQHEPV